MYGLNSDFQKRDVAIYARVSTEHEAQLSALGNQLDWYKPILAARPDWTLTAQYIDEGITGTSAEKRPQFMKMVEDAKLSQPSEGQIRLCTDRLYAVPRYDNAQCSDCGGQCDYSRTGTVSPRKRYDAAFIDDCQGEEAHQSEPDNRRYSAHACRR